MCRLIIKTLIVCFPLLLLGCEEKPVGSHLDDFIKPVTNVRLDSCENLLYKDTLFIRYGTFAGECIGYCEEEWKITRHCIWHKKTGTSEKIKYPTIYERNIFGKDEWNKLVAALDISKFNSLKERIRCPDCNDGGAEWVEVISNGKVKRVTFEGGNAPKEISELVELLRMETKQK